MASHRPQWRRLAILCLLGASSLLYAVKPPPHGDTKSIQSAGNVTCRYRLDGLQKDFTAGSHAEVSFSSLPPGDYTFEVSCDAARLEAPATGSYSFTVLAPWWQRWLTAIIGTIGVTLLVVGMLWKRHRDRLQNERLEKAVAERSAQLAALNGELQEASLCDPLTGVRNRRFFKSMIAADASQALRAYRGSEVYGRDHRDLIFFFVDIDHFKAVNDEFGHDAGDRVLVQIAQRLNRVVRESDFLIRWGGEEFLVVCRAADRGDGALLASRILKSVNGTDFDLGNDRRIARSCSVGWAAFPWLPPVCSDLSVDEVLRLADRGLYIAKERGRNQAVGMVAATTDPNFNVCATPPAGNIITKPDKYSTLEQLLEDDLIREERTAGEISAAAAG